MWAREAGCEEVGSKNNLQPLWGWTEDPVRSFGLCYWWYECTEDARVFCHRVKHTQMAQESFREDKGRSRRN